jgi:hypothetical protein
MSKLHIEILTPRTPYQTYLEERLQSASGLGWALPTAVAPAPSQAAARPAPIEFAVAAVGKPA